MLVYSPGAFSSSCCLLVQLAVGSDSHKAHHLRFFSVVEGAYVAIYINAKVSAPLSLQLMDAERMVLWIVCKALEGNDHLFFSARRQFGEVFLKALGEYVAHTLQCFKV